MIYFNSGTIATAYISGLTPQNVTIVHCGNGYVECELSTGDRVISSEPQNFTYVSRGTTNPTSSLIGGTPFATVYGGPKSSTFLGWDGRVREYVDSGGSITMSPTMGTMFL